MVSVNEQVSSVHYPFFSCDIITATAMAESAELEAVTVTELARIE